MSYYRYTNSSYNRPSFFGGFQFFPPVIKALLISNVAVLFFMVVASKFQMGNASLGDIIMSTFALYPLNHGFEVWQLFSYMFLHGGFMHLLFNMLALWMFGMQLENTWGAKKFFWYYLICGVGAGISNLLFNQWLGLIAPTVGASGAIYGVLLAFGMTYPDQYVLMIPFFVPMKAKYLVAMYIAIEVLSLGATDGVAHIAHLGGAAVGLAYILIDRRQRSFQSVWDETRNKFVTQEHAERSGSYNRNYTITDAKYYDIVDREQRVTQAQIDEILDKISQHGYQSLTEEEKKILFDASKKLN